MRHVAFGAALAAASALASAGSAEAATFDSLAEFSYADYS